MRRRREGKNTSCRVFVHNIPDYLEAYTVVRISDRQLYYYGTYKSQEEAEKKAKQWFNALVLQTRRVGKV